MWYGCAMNPARVDRYDSISRFLDFDGPLLMLAVPCLQSLFAYGFKLNLSDPWGRFYFLSIFIKEDHCVMTLRLRFLCVYPVYPPNDSSRWAQVKHQRFEPQNTARTRPKEHCAIDACREMMKENLWYVDDRERGRRQAILLTSKTSFSNTKSGVGPGRFPAQRDRFTSSKQAQPANDGDECQMEDELKSTKEGPSSVLYGTLPCGAKVQTLISLRRHGHHRYPDSKPIR
ncbi:hypothetical protein EV361DRAFT_864362 [Lentinula raphanica]|nr:hypothetical protein EV361DRAFT_864362 [Lentinula raphanica]